MHYMVSYFINIEADSPEEAAKQAHALIAHPDEASLYTYEVYGPSVNSDYCGEFTLNMKDELVKVTDFTLHK